jgi:hypothetical protein
LREFQQHRNRTWEQNWQVREQTSANLIAQVGALSEADLSRPGGASWQGRPFWRQIVGNGYIHPISHLADVYVRSGQPERAIALQERSVAAALPISDSEDWRGLLRYNLACVHSLAGMKEQAIAGLAEAFQLAPRLVEWSKQDHDLDPLRDDPAFQALYA